MTMEMRFLPFGGLPSDASTERSEYQIIEPVAGVAGQTVEFQISASQAGMIDLSQTYLLSRLTMAQAAPRVALARSPQSSRSRRRMRPGRASRTLCLAPSSFT